MNLQRGLERVSAVWWGFFGLLALVLFIGGFFSSDADRAGVLGGGFAGIVVCALAHKVTCWVVAGFFAPRS